MRPEIANLTKFMYKLHIEDHPTVLSRSENKILVPGMPRSFYWFDHKEKESFDLKSRSNQYEADFVVVFVEFLIRNGTDPSDITILVPYAGQFNCVKRNLSSSRVPEIERVVTKTIDRYQGEENEIVILSLTRSENPDAAGKPNIGFLRRPNRACVALSRAREALYVFGNSKHFERGSPKIWGKVISMFKERDSIGSGLEMECEIHNKRFRFDSPGSIQNQSPEGGCSEICTFRLPACGHQCQKRCHPFDRDHLQIKCIQKCQRVMESCPVKHICVLPCRQECGKECMTMVEKELPCKHKAQMRCCKQVDSYECKVLISKLFDCGHTAEVVCSQSKHAVCQETVLYTPMKCKGDHSYKKKCSEDEEVCASDCSERAKCGDPCSKLCPECEGDHVCSQKCTRQLLCGHTCQKMHPCDSRCPPCILSCRTACSHSNCSLKCGDPCTICIEPCERGCKHQRCSKLCGEPCDKSRCSERCTERLDCGHQCFGVCGEECIPCVFCKRGLIAFDESVLERPVLKIIKEDRHSRFIRLECKHIFDVRCIDSFIDLFVEESHSEEDMAIRLPTCPKCRASIWRCSRYTEVINEIILLINRIKRMNWGLTEEEKLSIRGAMYDEMNSYRATGHFFKHSCGYLYFIGDCGGAMQATTCPECGGILGGSSHRLAEGNAHDAEFDVGRRDEWNP